MSCLVHCVCLYCSDVVFFFFFKQKTAYEMRISDWSSDVCSSDLLGIDDQVRARRLGARDQHRIGISPQITHQLIELGKRNNETIGHRAGPYSCVIPAQTGIHERRSGQVRTGPCPRNPAFAGMTQSFNTMLNKSEEHTSELQSL